MAMEPSFFEHEVHFESEDVALKPKWKSISTPTGISDDDGDCFDCNICLDSAQDPIVTLCGHLYCWPCIYKWLQVQSSPDANEQQPSCPVCKANISQNSLVPLYGRGTCRADSASKKASPDVVIPRRPPPALNTLISNTSQQATSQIFNPMIGMFGEMMFARIFGTSDASLFAYYYPNSNHLMGGYSHRMRRQEMQLEKSLNRVTIFLLCCIILCLLLF
ncbi:E3 ubiquitin-protein ligase RMA1H1 isoform X2 [Hevea brasiliensis]|uniref:E3 ubiquitin-protein ligase RMA1H1 isoform X2 n=1 Tax=Hevea brasiliensis TaxID=3981 RepID=UPI0025CFF966|nr:E3 ubiquitin-protein ligase RMA1H1 isoform X2 [Hevea brasiliensis]